MKLRIMSLIEWIRAKHSELMPLEGLVVMKQAASKYHEELNIEGQREYSEGWLQKFKSCRAVKYLKISRKMLLRTVKKM